MLVELTRKKPRGYSPLTYAYDLCSFERTMFDAECRRLQRHGVDFVAVQFDAPVRVTENDIADWPSNYAEIWVKDAKDSTKAQDAAKTCKR